MDLTKDQVVHSHASETRAKVATTMVVQTKGAFRDQGQVGTIREVVMVKVLFITLLTQNTK